MTAPSGPGPADRSSRTPTPLLARVRAAVDAAGLWDELHTDWLMLDAEIMPWSAKAQGLIRDQYAPVGAAAGAALPAALAVVGRGRGARPRRSAASRDRLAARRSNADGFRAAYRRYSWPVAGLDGLRVAPFAVLAGAGFNAVTRDNALASRHGGPAGRGRSGAVRDDAPAGDHGRRTPAR